VRRTAVFVLLLLVGCGSGGTPASSRSPEPSASPTPTPSPSPSPGRIPPIHQGDYVFDVTREDARRAGFPPSQLDENSGHTRVTLDAGRWQSVQTANHPISNPFAEGTYSGDGHRVAFVTELPSIFAGETVQLTWRYDPKTRLLYFTVISISPNTAEKRSYAKAYYGTHPWKRVG
jgi:hypothetical protein